MMMMMMMMMMMVVVVVMSCRAIYLLRKHSTTLLPAVWKDAPYNYKD